MLTNQFNTVLKNFVGGTSFLFKKVSGGSTTITIPTSRYNSNFYYNVHDNMVRIPWIMSKGVRVSNIGDSSDGGVYFGGGNTEPTANDYNLAEPLTLSSCTVTKNITQSGNTVTGVFNIVNNSTVDYTIAEVGLFGEVPYNDQFEYSYLIDRTVLDNPVTVPANGGIGQVTYTITVS